MGQEHAELAAIAASKWDWPKSARPNQLPPAGEWLTWLVLAGRGFGKTRCGAEWVRAEGFRVFRVRYNIAKDGAITAKLQVDPSELARLYPLTTQLERDLRLMGFSRMMIDPIGYQPPKRTGKVISDR